MTMDGAQVTQVYFGEQVRWYRKQAGLTLKQLAHRVKKAEASVSRIENGKQNVTLGDIALLAEALQVSVAVLFGAPATATLPPEERESYQLFKAFCQQITSAIPPSQKGHKSYSLQKYDTLYQKCPTIVPKWHFV